MQPIVSGTTDSSRAQGVAHTAKLWHSQSCWYCAPAGGDGRRGGNVCGSPGLTVDSAAAVLDGIRALAAWLSALGRLLTT